MHANTLLGKRRVSKSAAGLDAHAEEVVGWFRRVPVLEAGPGSQRRALDDRSPELCGFGQRSFIGALDEIAIYDKALDDGRVERHYLAGVVP